jgi:copper transport protein
LQRAVVAIAVVLAALAAAPSAFGHAILLQTTPSNGTILREAPPTIDLRFNEAVETAFGSLRLYACDGSRIDSGEITRPAPDSVSTSVGRSLPRGTYTVTWRVISADGHPLSGAFLFHIGEAAEAGECVDVFGSEATPRSSDVLFKVTRAANFLLMLLVAGGAVALALVLRSAAADLRRRLYGVLSSLSIALLMTAILCIVFQGAVAGGFGLGEAFRWGTVDAVLDTRFGKAYLVQAIAAGAAAVLAFLAGWSRLALGPAVVIPAALALTAPTASGHAYTTGWLAILTDYAHVAAASVWVGGLGFLLAGLLMAGRDRWPLASRAVPMFSLLAVGSVAVLIAAGTVRGYEEVRGWSGLWETTYGLLLLAKIALVLPLLALGAYNNRFAVPRLRKQIASVLEQRRFLRAIGTELAIMTVIVGVTAVLVAEPPARAATEPTRYFSTIAPIGDLEVNVTVDPARTGPNEMHFYFFQQNGVPADISELRVTARLPRLDVGPLRIRLQKIVPSHYTTPRGIFPIAGDWELTLAARRGEFELTRTTIPFEIRKG